MRKIAFIFVVFGLVTGSASAKSLGTDLLELAHNYHFYGCDAAILKTFSWSIKDADKKDTDDKWSGNVQSPRRHGGAILTAWVLLGSGANLVESEATFIKTAHQCVAIRSLNVNLPGSCANNMKRDKIVGSVGHGMYGRTPGGIQVIGIPANGYCHVEYAQAMDAYPHDK